MTPGKRITIADIKTSDILFYDPDLRDQCYKFCAKRNIDCLPALDDSMKVFIRDETAGKFKEDLVTEDRIVSGDFNIFAPEMLERFRKHPLLMVYHGDHLNGVVHFCDYNKPVVSLYLYELFFNFERALRTYLILKGLSNEDMLGFFGKKKAKESVGYYEKKIEEYREHDSKKKLPPFEVFYLTDLIALINHKKIIKIADLGRLRNMVMHVNEFVNMHDPHTEDQIYDFESFRKFFELNLQLHLDFRRVSNRLAFLSEG